jgi:hypothetical protein
MKSISKINNAIFDKPTKKASAKKLRQPIYEIYILKLAELN